jgi:hypothetical protein
MITNTGRRILSKYLVGQAPAYASYIALGCGARPLGLTDNFDDYSLKTALDFEMFRVPIISRGFATKTIDIGQEQTRDISEIVFTAELPTDERYEISEVGVYSAGSNPSASGTESRSVFLFSQTENWEYHSSTSSVAVPVISRPLDQPDTGTNPNPGEIVDNDYQVFSVNADNPAFENDARRLVGERPRFFNNTILIKGNTSNILSTSLSETLPQSQKFAPLPGSSHIHLNGSAVNLDRYSPIDEVRFAFSVISQVPGATPPNRVRLAVDFASSDLESETNQYARFATEVSSQEMAANRYFVKTARLEDLAKTDGFTWGIVAVSKVHALALEAQNPINGKEVSSNVVTLSTSGIHNYAIGDTVYVENLHPDLNGVFTITNIPTTTKFSYAKTLPNSSFETVPLLLGASASRPLDNFYISLDAVRVENMSTVNPLYGLTGYSVVKNSQALPIIKESNTSNLVEFRFAMDVLSDG